MVKKASIVQTRLTAAQLRKLDKGNTVQHTPAIHQSGECSCEIEVPDLKTANKFKKLSQGKGFRIKPQDITSLTVHQGHDVLGSGFFDSVGSFFKKAGNTIKDTAQKGFNGAKDVVNSRQFKNTINTIKSGAQQAGNATLKGLKDTVNDATFKQAVGTLGNAAIQGAQMYGSMYGLPPQLTMGPAMMASQLLNQYTGEPAQPQEVQEGAGFFSDLLSKGKVLAKQGMKKGLDYAKSEAGQQLYNQAKELATAKAKEMALKASHKVIDMAGSRLGIDEGTLNDIKDHSADLIDQGAHLAGNMADSKYSDFQGSGFLLNQRGPAFAHGTVMSQGQGMGCCPTCGKKGYKGSGISPYKDDGMMKKKSGCGISPYRGGTIKGGAIAEITEENRIKGLEQSFDSLSEPMLDRMAHVRSFRKARMP